MKRILSVFGVLFALCASAWAQPCQSVPPGDVCINNASASQSRRWEVVGLRAENIPTAENTSVSISATSLILYNPNTKLGLAIGPTDVPAGLTNSINTIGIGGRDGTPSYVMGDEVFFYFVAKDDGTLNTINSRVCPRCLNAEGIFGPTLTSDYTTYAPSFSLVMGDAAGLTHDNHQGEEAFHQSFTASTSGTHMVTSGEPSGPLTIGWKVRGPGVANDTFIISMVSHTGTGGDYILSIAPAPASSQPFFAYPPFPTGFLVNENKLWFKSAILDYITVPFSPAAPYPWSYARWVPLSGKTIDVELDPEITGNFTTSAFITAWGSGNDLNLSTYSYNGNVTAQNLVAEFPVTSGRTMNMIWLQGGGATTSTVSVNFLRGYTFGF